MDAPLVLHWSDPLQERIQQIGVAIVALSLVSVFVVLFIVFPIEQLAKMGWASVWEKMLLKPSGLIALFSLLVVYPLVIVYALWATRWYKKHARIFINDRTVTFVSGVPWLGKWMDWTWDLEAVRSQKILLKIVHSPLGSQPLRMCRLSWGQLFTKQMRPFVWHLPGQAVVHLAKPQSVWGLVRWGTPGNTALLQQQFDQLPLIAALKQRGVFLPSIAGKSQHLAGLDLMERPRMRLAVWSFFGTLAWAFVLFHVMRHQHFFSAPHLGVWIGAGGLAGLMLLRWLWQENAGDTVAEGGKWLELRASQVIVAGLFGMAVGLCAPSVPLVLSSMAKASEETVFTLQKSPLLLRAPAGGEVPDFAPRQALDYWASLPNGERVSLPVRQGFAGWWWQFDSNVLSDKLEIFYDDQYDRAKAKNR